MYQKGPNNESVKNYVSILRAHSVLLGESQSKKKGMQLRRLSRVQQNTGLELYLKFKYLNFFEKTTINLLDQLGKECRIGNLVYSVLQWKLKFFFQFCDFYSI